MRLLFLLDPYAGYNWEKDTSHLLMLAAHRRGHRVWYATLAQLEAGRRGVEVTASPVVPEAGPPYFAFRPAKRVALSRFAAVFIRKDPPVNDAYRAALELLAREETKTRFVNAPSALLRHNEKLVILNFPRLIPPTCVATQVDRVADFLRRQKHGAVLKSLASFAGRGVARVPPGAVGWEEDWERLSEGGRVPVMAQAFLPAVHGGEKRIFLVRGRPLATLLKRPAPGDFLATGERGTTFEATALTVREEALCRTLAPFLRKEGIAFAGADVIDGRLTELNLTSPGLLWELNEVTNRRWEGILLTRLLGRTRRERFASSRRRLPRTKPA